MHYNAQSHQFLLKSMKNIFTILLFAFSSTFFAQKKINVLLIGSFHFNNPGYDAAKVEERNILSTESQNELESIVQKIAHKYKPSKIFLEYDKDSNNQYNGYYHLYKNGQNFYNNDTIRKSSLKRYFAENEIFQFGFRLAKAMNLQKIYGIDYEIEVRFDLLKSKMELNPQMKFVDYEKKTKLLGSKINDCIQIEKLKEVFKCINNPDQYKFNKSFYIEFFNRMNSSKDFYGSTLAADWQKRNLIMFSEIQNKVEASDENIVILVGAGHAAMIEDYIKLDSRFNLVKINKIF